MMKSAFNVHVHMVDICVRVGQTSGLPLGSGFNTNVRGWVVVCRLVHTWQSS